MATSFPTSPPALPVSQAPNNWLSTYTQGVTLTGDPTKNNQLSANAAGITLVGGPGDDTFIAYDPWTSVVGNGGTDTVETWGSGYTLPAGVANLTLEGSGNAFATGNSGNNIITGNGGTDILTTGGGNDILIAGTGADTFVPTVQANTTTWIEGFNPSLDKIDLSAYGFTSFSAFFVDHKRVDRQHIDGIDLQRQSRQPTGHDHDLRRRVQLVEPQHGDCVDRGRDLDHLLQRMERSHTQRKQRAGDLRRSAEFRACWWRRQAAAKANA